MKTKCTIEPKSVEKRESVELNAEESQIVTVFTAKWCGACKSRVPEIVKRATAAGFEVKLIDIDDVENVEPKERKILRRVEYVPHIDYMGHEVEEEELDRICKANKAKEGHGKVSGLRRDGA